MQLESILARGRTVCDVPGSSKKKVLENLAEIISRDVPELDADNLFNSLNAREKLGSTGIGHGIAIPHCRASNCSRTAGALVRLAEAVDFDAPDDEAVDIVFALVVPEEATDEHLQTLAVLAELFEQQAFRQSLRAAEDADALYQAAIDFARAA